MRSIFLIKPQR